MMQQNYTVLAYFDAPREAHEVAELRLLCQTETEARTRADAILNKGIELPLDQEGSVLAVPRARVRAVEIWAGDHSAYPAPALALRRVSEKLLARVDNDD